MFQPIFCLGAAVGDIENRVLCLRENIVFASFEEGGVIFNLEDRVSHFVNRSGLHLK